MSRPWLVEHGSRNLRWGSVIFYIHPLNVNTTATTYNKLIMLNEVKSQIWMSRSSTTFASAHPGPPWTELLLILPLIDPIPLLPEDTDADAVP